MRLIPILLLAAACSDAPPLAGPVEIQGFETPTTVGTGSVVTIPYTGSGAVDFYADGDGDLATTNDQVLIATGVSGGSVDWNTAGVPPGDYRIVARGSDGMVAVSSGVVTVNTAPTLSIVRVSGVASSGNALDILYVDDDPDDAALTSIFIDADGDLSTTADQTEIVTDRPDGNGSTQTTSWDTRGVPLGTYMLFLRTSDAVSSVTVSSVVEVVANVASLTLLRGTEDTYYDGLHVMPDGTAYVTGALHDSPAPGGVYVARYESDGTLDWERVAVGPGNAAGWALDAFSDGSCVVTGRFTLDLTFGVGEADETTLTSSATDGGTDAFLARHTADGTLAWVFPVGDATASDIGIGVAALPDGSCVWGGLFHGTLTYGVSAGDADAFLARHAADGSLIWSRTFGGAGRDSVGGIGVMPDGSLVVSGSFEETVVFGAGEANETTLTADGGSDIFIARFESDGTLRWVKRAGGTGDDYGRRPVARADGTFVLSGGFSATATFDTVTLQSAGSVDMFIAVFDDDGNVVFARGFGGAGNDDAIRLAAHPDGSFAMTGWFVGSFAMDTFTVSSVGGGDAVTAVFESDGTVRWARSDGGGLDEIGLGVGFMPDGSLLAAGRFGNPAASATFGRGDVNETTVVSSGGHGGEGYLIRFNRDGKY